jgi:hypothetical protein
MRDIKWITALAAGALILAGVVMWTNSTTRAFVPAPKLSQIDPLQIMTSAKDLPTQTYEDRTFVF